MILPNKYDQNLNHPAMTGRGIETFAEPAKGLVHIPQKFEGSRLSSV